MDCYRKDIAALERKNAFSAKKHTLPLVVFLGIISLMTNCAPDTVRITHATAHCSTISGSSQSSNNAMTSGPVASSIYVGTSEAGTPTRTEGSRDIYALRASDGALRWRCSTSTPGGFSATPVVDHDVLYALAGSLHYVKDEPPTTVQALYALRQSDGAQVWQFVVQGISGSGPLLANHVIYVVITTHAVSQFNPSVVFALRASDGMQLWQAQVGDGGDGRVLLAMDHDTIYTATEDGLLTALNISDGTQRWHYQTNCLSSKALMTRRDTVYITGCTTVSALKARTGTLRWRFHAGDAITQHPLLSEGILYVGSANHTISALKVSDGRLLWQHHTDDVALVPTAVMDGVIYITAETPSAGPSSKMTLYAFRVSDGTQLWRFQNEADTHPLVASNGVIYLGIYHQFTLPGFIVALRASDGTILWRSRTNASVARFSDVSNGMISISSSYTKAQDITAVRVSDGRLLWHYTIPYDRAPVFLTDPVTGPVR